MSRASTHPARAARPIGEGSIDAAETTDLLRETLSYAHERGYRGYDYSDGMSSAIRQVLPIDNTWVNLAFQETAKRAPVNLRPMLLIPRRRSFKGAGLFALANIGMYELTGEATYLDEAEGLVEWLLERRNESPFGWGHNHDIQLLDHTKPRNTPSIVATAYVTRAILRLADHVEPPGYELVADGVPSLLEDLAVRCPDGATRLRYDPTAGTDSFVLNANAIGGALLVELASEFGEPDLRTLGEEILDGVADAQHPTGGWTYTVPPEASHLSMDNHHNGFVIESFLRHRALTGSARFEESIESGLRFYREELFEPDGAPNWDESNRFPRDVHAAAQGIVTFVTAGDRSFAGRVLGWTKDSLHGGGGAFYFRRGRLWTRRFTLMRWCQAWMAYALSRYRLALEGEQTGYDYCRDRRSLP